MIDAQGSQDVLRSGIETSHTNIAVQDANIAEAKAKLWQLEQDYHRFERLLKEESVPEQQYEQSKAAFEAAQARYQALVEQKKAAFSQFTETSKKNNRSRGGDLTKRSGSGFSEVKPFLYRYNRPLRRSCRQTDLRARTIRASRTNDILPRTR